MFRRPVTLLTERRFAFLRGVTAAIRGVSALLPQYDGSGAAVIGASHRFNSSSSSSSSSSTGTTDGADGSTAQSSAASSPEVGAETPSSTSASTSNGRKIQIAVVGSGPSGCFVASYLTKKNPCIHVDIYERLPVSFGLCRYGVAPDHPDVKNVERQYMELFKSSRATWIGNVSIGKEIPVEAVLQHYAAVVFATGAETSRKLSIPGEELGGVLVAKDIVSYYNTVPFPHGSPRFCPFDLERTSRVAIVGNGNVAMDVSRVLAGSYKYFCETDMNCVALRELMKNRIRQIDVIGRRGVEHSAFAIAEFRELTKYQEGGVSVQVDPFSLEAALSAPGKSTARAHKRLMELVHKSAVSQAVMERDLAETAADEHGRHILRPPSSAAGTQGSDGSSSSSGGGGASTSTAAGPGAGGVGPNARGPCAVRFRYNLAPVAILPSQARKNYVGGLLCERTTTATSTPTDASGTGGGGDGSAIALGKEYCVIPCDLVIKSIGYRGDRVPGIPFDERSGVIPNAGGRVDGLPRVYCSGWAKTGSKGVILHSVVDAQETVAAILEDISKGLIPTVGDDTAEADSNRNSGSSGNEGGGGGSDGICALPPLTSTTTTMYGKYGLVDYFVTKKLEPVSVAGLERILNSEKQRGIDLGKRAEKLDAVRDMLDIALGGEVGKKADEKVRGVTPARAEAMMYLKELLDDDTDLGPLAHSLAKDLPRKLAAQHPAGRIAPTQL